VLGDTRNIKVTFPEDLAIAELILGGRDGKAARKRPAPKSRNRPARNNNSRKRSG
jgi:hypothetical protein